MVNLKKISKMNGLALKNALRLHFDSILLFNKKSYPSAYYLSALTQEELGKVFILDDFLYHSTVDKKYLKVEKEHLSFMYNHLSKQQWFIGENWPDLYKKFIKEVTNGKLETAKQNSLYVGFERKKKKINLKGKIKSPFNIKRDKVKRQITVINDFLKEFTFSIMNHFGTMESGEGEALLNKKLFLKLQKSWKYTSKKTKRNLLRMKKALGSKKRE